MPDVGHPGAVALSEYLDDDLSPWEHAAIGRHVRHCIACRRRLASLTRTLRALASLRDETPISRTDAIIDALGALDAHGGAARRDRAALARTSRWAVARGLVPSSLLRAQLHVTLPGAVLLGLTLSFLNQGGALLEGRIDLEMTVICALNLALPFIALNVALVMATSLARDRGRAMRRRHGR